MDKQTKAGHKNGQAKTFGVLMLLVAAVLVFTDLAWLGMVAAVIAGLTLLVTNASERNPAGASKRNVRD